jgi:hypothetical protein
VNRRFFLLVPLVVLAFVVGAASASAANKPPSTLAAYQACLKAHGVTFGAPSKLSAAKTKAAFAACASKAPAGVRTGRPPNGARFNSPAFQKYIACLKTHGIAFKPGTRPNRTSAAFKAADKACASLRPKRPAPPTNG